MRRDSIVMKQCTLLYKGLRIDRKAVLQKTRLLLKIYRPVVWSASNRVFEVCESAEIYSSKKMEEALEFLANYAPETEQEKFSEKVRSLFETRWLISLIDNTVNKIYGYPHNGKLYYDKKKEALDIFAIC